MVPLEEIVKVVITIIAGGDAEVEFGVAEK